MGILNLYLNRLQKMQITLMVIWILLLFIQAVTEQDSGA